MPPRWMQGKLQKMKRARKTYPKWLRSGGMTKVHVEAYDAYNSRRATASQLKDKPETLDQEHLGEAYIDPVTGFWVAKSTITQEKYILQKRVGEELQEVRERSERCYVRNELVRVWSGKRGQGITTLVGTTVEEAGTYKLRLYFSGQEFVFVQTVGEDRWISKTYTRQEAYDALQASRIAWVQRDKTTG